MPAAASSEPRWPLARSLAALTGRGRDRLALHLPAHRRGQGAPGGALRGLPWHLDLPELPAIGGPLEADGAVADSQRRLAACVGAEHSWYGVNGASGLLQAALLAAVPPGGRVMLPRNLHRSLLHGCVLGHLRPVLYSPPFDTATGLWLPPTAAQLAAWLPEVLASGPLDLLVLLSPTYQGRAAPLADLVAVAHGASVPVLVDEAHGGHFGLVADLPPAALAAGADLVVQSLAKSLGSLAQTAVLHRQGPHIAVEAVERALGWLQTSSPSLPLLLAAERSIAWAWGAAGRRRLARRLHQARRLATALRDRGLPLLPGDDPLRLVLATAPLGWDGPAADAWLLDRGVIAECPEVLSLTFCLGLGPVRGLERPLGRALASLAAAGGVAPPALAPLPHPPLAEPELPPGVAWRAPSRLLPLAEAEGEVAAEPLCPYPPGIPLLLPGERIHGTTVAWLQDLQRRWHGQIADTVRVLA